MLDHRRIIMALAALLALPVIVLTQASPASAATCNNPDSGYKYQTWTQPFEYAVDTGQGGIINTHTGTKVSTLRYKTCGSSPNVKVRPFYSRIDVTWSAGSDAAALAVLGEDVCVAAGHDVHSLQLGYQYGYGLCLPAPTNGVSSVTIPIDVGTDNWLLMTYEPVWSGYLYTTTDLVVMADNPLNFTTSAGLDYKRFKPATDPSS